MEYKQQMTLEAITSQPKKQDHLQPLCAHSDVTRSQDYLVTDDIAAREKGSSLPPDEGRAIWDQFS